ncbi:MAG: hypothetical protein ACREDR_47905, partial [Blastocatellia bacterium]
MTTRTAEEAKANYIEKMGEPLGTQFAALFQEVARLHMVWGEFAELFGDEPRVMVLNQAAPAMFHIIGHALWQLTLLDIARLTDPPKSVGKKNLTIQNLPGLVKPEVKADLEELVGAALEKSDFCRDQRNRQLAHLDLDLLTNESAKPLEPATMKAVNEAIDAIGRVLKEVHLHYIGALGFSRNVGDAGNALALLRLLQHGLIARKWK